MTTRISAALLAGFLPCAAAQPASTPEPSALRATPTPDANASASASLAPTAEDERNGTRYFGLLRARDLSFFSLSHLDLRPAHAVVASPGGWGLEAQVAYQNTAQPSKMNSAETARCSTRSLAKTCVSGATRML